MSTFFGCPRCWKNWVECECDMNQPAISHGDLIRASNEAWVKCSERMPMRKDGDTHGDVYAYNTNGEQYIVAWYDMTRATVDMLVTHWATPLLPPMENQPATGGEAE